MNYHCLRWFTSGNKYFIIIIIVIINLIYYNFVGNKVKCIHWCTRPGAAEHPAGEGGEPAGGGGGEDGPAGEYHQAPPHISPAFSPCSYTIQILQS